MKISGIMQFQGMSAAGINLVRGFQLNHPDIPISFAADLATAIVEWESFNALSYLTRLAAAVQTCDSERARSNKLSPADATPGLGRRRDKQRP